MGRCCGSEGSNPHVVALRRVSPALLLVLLVGLMHSPGVPGAVANQGSGRGDPPAAQGDRVSSYVPQGWEQHNATAFQELVRRNLHADLAPWLQQQQQQPGGGPITVGAFARFVYDMATRGSAMARGTHLALVLVLRGRLHVVPLSERPSTLMTKRLAAMRAKLHALLPLHQTPLGLSLAQRQASPPFTLAGSVDSAVPSSADSSNVDMTATASAAMRPASSAAGPSSSSDSLFPPLTLPDTAFILTAWDDSGCSARTGRWRETGPHCAAPVLSYFKRWDDVSGTAEELDVLVPLFNHEYGPLVFYPWEQKDTRALMRAGIKHAMPRNCSRVQLLQLQSQHPEGQQLLDVGISSSSTHKYTGPLAKPIPMPDHARWRYLLSTDGVTASARLGKLLGMNSVVLKEASPWIEWYYRSLEPRVHHVPFEPGPSLFAVLKHLEQHSQEAQRIAEAAQRFQLLHLSTYSKALYLREVLLSYNGLFVRHGMGALTSRLARSCLRGASAPARAGAGRLAGGIVRGSASGGGRVGAGAVEGKEAGRATGVGSGGALGTGSSIGGESGSPLRQGSFPGGEAEEFDCSLAEVLNVVRAVAMEEQQVGLSTW